jgi:hypothetical protein
VLHARHYQGTRQKHFPEIHPKACHINRLAFYPGNRTTKFHEEVIMYAINIRLKILAKRLVAFTISLIAGFIAAYAIVMPTQYLVQWLVGHDYSNPPSLWEAWYLWPIFILMLTLTFFFQKRFYKWLARRFGIPMKCGLRYVSDDS